MSLTLVGAGPSVLRAGATTVVLPQNLTNDAGTEFEDFETAGDWNAPSGTLAANTSEFKTGTQSIKFTSAAGGFGNFNETVSWDLSDKNELMRLWVYKHDSNVTSIIIYLTSDPAFGKYFQYTQQISTWAVGWNRLSIGASEWVNQGTGESWDNTMTLFRIAMQGAQGSISVDNLMVGVDAVGAVAMMFDDALNEHYDQAFAYMDPLGVRGTAYVISDRIDADPVGWLTSAQLAEMDAGGWAIGNHSSDTTLFTSLTQAEIETKLAACKSALDGLGLTDASAHVAYPGGAYDADTLAAMTAQGMLTGRAGVSENMLMPFDDNHILDVRTVTNLTAAQGWIDTAKNKAELCFILMHTLTGADITLLQDIIDYIISSGVAVVTIKDVYDLLSGPVTVPVP